MDKTLQLIKTQCRVWVDELTARIDEIARRYDLLMSVNTPADSPDLKRIVFELSEAEVNRMKLDELADLAEGAVKKR